MDAIDKKKLKELYNRLNDFDKEYSLCVKKANKDNVRKRVQSYVENNISPDLYFKLNYDSASGFFEYGHYDADMNHCLRVLDEMIQE